VTWINAISGFLGDALLGRFDSPWLALVVVALATSILMLLIVRWSSSPEAVERSKKRLTARVLELVLYRHDAMVSLTAGGRILRENLSYLKTLLLPIVLSTIPGLLILAQLACWFDARPLHVGEAAVLEVTFRDGTDLLKMPSRIDGADAVRIETDPVRVPRRSEVSWRLRGVRPGIDAIQLHYGDEPPIMKRVAVGDSLQKVSRRRSAAGLWEQWLHPVEPPIPDRQAIIRIDVRYPQRSLELGNWEIHWLVAFLGLTIVFALLLKRPLGVRM
jgi:hypothetical protein